MSRAFVKDAAGEDGEPLPDRPISAEPNYVTARGLALFEAELDRLNAALAAAGDDRAARATIERDLRYWRARRASAELVPPPIDATSVRFGSKVTIARKGGRRQTWKIVGEDEADPAKGSLPYVAPLARALVGKSVGDIILVAGEEAEIVRIA